MKSELLHLLRYDESMQQIYRLISGRFFLNLAFAAPVQTLFFQARGLSLTQVMILQSLLLGCVLLLEVPTGIIGDRIGKKWSVLCGIGCALLAWIPWLMAEDIWVFGIAFALLGISQAFISGSDQALLYELLSAKGKSSDMKRIYGLYLSMSTIGYAIAGLVGGFLAINQTLAEFIHLYVLTAISQGCAFLLYLSVKEPKATVDVSDEVVSSFKILKSSIRLFIDNRNLRRIIILSLLTTPFSVALFTLFQPYFVSSGVPSVWFGIALFISSMAATGSKIFAHKLESWFGVGWSTLLTTILPGMLWLLMAVVFNPFGAVMLFILSDAAGNVRDPIFADYLNRHIPSAVRATTLSLVSVMTSLYLLVMQPVIGWLADIDMKWAFMFMGAVIILGSMFAKVSDRHVISE